MSASPARRYLPTPPQVANVFGSPQSPMFSLEHGLPAVHPLLAAFGSQSCAALFPHDVAQAEVATSLIVVTQQTVPAAQFAAEEHASAVVSPPPGGRGQVLPATQV